MNSLFLYILHSSIVLSVLFAAYFLLLRKETFFSFNRMFLIITIILSFVIPFLSLPLTSPIQEELLKQFSVDNFFNIPAVNPSPDLTPVSTLTTGMKNGPFIYFILTYLYLLGFLVFSSITVLHLIKIASLQKNLKKQNKGPFRLYLHSLDLPPFSFFSAVFLNKQLIRTPEIEPILAHERTHINQYHSLDIVLLALTKSIHWFNPFVWLLIRSLKEIHEFLADRSVMQKGYDRKKYQILILNYSVSGHNNLLASTLTNSLSKRRIDMMNRPRSGRLARFKPLLILPVVLLLSASFQNRGIALELPAVPDEKPAFIGPLSSGRLTRGFEQSINPFTHKPEFHHGLDIAAPLGTNVRAVCDGVVILSDSSQGYGNQIYIGHAHGFRSYYSHLLNRLVSTDQKVKAGDIIGQVGNSGKSTASHLHFELQHKNIPVDPAEEIDISVYQQKK